MASSAEVILLIAPTALVHRAALEAEPLCCCEPRQGWAKIPPGCLAFWFMLLLENSSILLAAPVCAGCHCCEEKWCCLNKLQIRLTASNYDIRQLETSPTFDPPIGTRCINLLRQYKNLWHWDLINMSPPFSSLYLFLQLLANLLLQ